MKDVTTFTETQDLLMSIIGGVPYGIIAMDMEGLISIVNTQALSLLNVDKKANEVIDTKAIKILGKVEVLKDHLKDCIKKGRHNIDLTEVQFNEKYLNIRGRKILNGMMITIADVTSIKKAQNAVLNMVLEGQEQERKRLARELHDGIGPMLSTIKVNLVSIEDEFSDLHEALWTRFQKSYQLIDDVSDDLRSVSHNLLPKVLLDFGLAEALETLCVRIEKRKGLKVTFIASGLSDRYDQAIELGLYRICQELINNTLKYAQAKNITLQLIQNETEIRLTYEDDGVGFDPEQQSEGIGHMNIQNRVTALSGQIDIDSQPDNGMTASVIIPLNYLIP